MSTKFALLGLLNIRKMSAYDLAKFAKESIGYFWNESYSNVHRTLKILVDEELIKKLPEKRSRNKNIFEITDLGRQALSEWLSNHEHTTIYRDELLLKLFVSKRHDYPALLIDLKNALNELREQKQIYSKLQEFVSTRPDNLSYDLVLDYGIVENEATIKWLEKSIKRIDGEVIPEPWIGISKKNKDSWKKLGRNIAIIISVVTAVGSILYRITQTEKHYVSTVEKVEENLIRIQSRH